MTTRYRVGNFTTPSLGEACTVAAQAVSEEHGRECVCVYTDPGGDEVARVWLHECWVRDIDGTFRARQFADTHGRYVGVGTGWGVSRGTREAAAERHRRANAAWDTAAFGGKS